MQTQKSPSGERQLENTQKVYEVGQKLGLDDIATIPYSASGTLLFY